MGGRITFALLTPLQSAACVTLGVEAPVWLPVPRDVDDLSRSRVGEGNRSCFAPAGGYVAALGVHQLAYVLDGVRDLRRATTRWNAWDLEARTLLIWEAFVSGPSHTTTQDHVADATTAAIEFVERARRGVLTTDVPHVRGQVLSLAAGVVLWAGLSDDVEELHEATLVIKPKAARTLTDPATG